MNTAIAVASLVSMSMQFVKTGKTCLRTTEIKQCATTTPLLTIQTPSPKHLEMHLRITDTRIQNSKKSSKRCNQPQMTTMKCLDSHQGAKGNSDPTQRTAKPLRHLMRFLTSTGRCGDLKFQVMTKRVRMSRSVLPVAGTTRK